MGSLYIRLFVVLNEEKPDSAFYHIALMMLKHMDALQSFSIGELSMICNVSKSTISKFIRKIGYEDFADFRYAAIFMDNKYRTDINYVDNVMGFLERNSPDVYFLTVIQDITATWRNMDWNAVDRLVKDIAEYEEVAAFGYMFSESAALDLQIKLGFNRKFIFTKQNDLKQDEYIERAGADTLIIIFSDSGEYLNRYPCISDFTNKRIFDRTKAKIVVVTSNPEVEKDPRVAYYVPYWKTSALRTHRTVYGILTDIIAFRYRQFIRREREQG